MACCAGLPCWVSISMAPWVSTGHVENPRLAEASISCITIVTSHGNPPPPNSGGNGTAPTGLGVLPVRLAGTRAGW